MTLEEFEKSLAGGSLPKGLSAPLQALWYDATEQWHKAHQIAQDDNSGDAAWVHAYLHRKEGDTGNARYWYSRAGKAAASGSLSDEWRAIAGRLLGQAE